MLTCLALWENRSITKFWYKKNLKQKTKTKTRGKTNKQTKTKQNKRGNQLKRETLTPCPFLGIQKPCVVCGNHTKAPEVYTHIHAILYALGLSWKIWMTAQNTKHNTFYLTWFLFNFLNLVDIFFSHLGSVKWVYLALLQSKLK